MSKNCFEIIFKRQPDNALFRATVEILEQSEKLARFAVRAGEKEMLLEKRLSRKKDQWEIIRINFEMKGNPRVNARMILGIQNGIDDHLKKIDC